MKKFYKFATAFLALIMLLPFGTIHAAAYDDCDVNHDGYVDISDAVLLSRYLAGDLYISNYNRFDTNKSLTIDISDVEKIFAKIQNISYSAQYWNKYGNTSVSFPTVSGFTPEPGASSISSRSYIKHSYTYNQNSSYTLTPNVANFNAIHADPTPRNLIGIDDRHPSLGVENTGIVNLGGWGTGFIIDDHTIATAAHCVFNRSTHQFISTPTIHPYNSNGTLNTSLAFTPKEAHIPIMFDISFEEDCSKYDYALITVSDDLSNYMHFSLGTTYNLSSTNYSTIPLYLLGPRMVGSGTSSYDLYYSQGNIISGTNTTSTSLIYYNLDSLPGESGAPVYTITRANIDNQIYYYYTAIAIHTCNDGKNPSEWNAGNRITKYQLQFFDADSNSNISW